MSATVIQLEQLRAQARVAPGTVNEKARTVDVAFYSGATVMRSSWLEGDFGLTFSMDPKHVELSRLNGRANVLDSHDSGRLSSVLGVVERAWISNGKGYATIRFSDRAEVEPIWQDVKSGILANVSMGAIVHELTDTTPKGSRLKQFLATRWEPAEISLVAVPADAGAQTLAAGETFACSIINGDTMDPTKIISNEPTADVVAERARSSEILRACKVAKLEGHVAETLIANGATLEKAQSEIFRLMAERDEAQPIRTTYTVGAEYDSLNGPNGTAERMAQALAWRSSPTMELPDAARQFARFTLADVAGEILRAKGLHVSGMAKSRLIDLALSNSDFPGLLANVANKTLMPAYETAMPTYLTLSAGRVLRDFKAASIIGTGDFPLPLLVPEGGSVQLGYFSERTETWALLDYARRIAVTRQALVNDDLHGFGTVMDSYARRIRDFENSLWFTSLTSNGGVGPTMGDGLSFFHATHANLAGTATAISLESLSTGRIAMQKQMSMDGLKLNSQPRFLLCPPEKITLAEQHLATIAAASASNVNPFAGRITPISDANLSGNAWYLFADPSTIACALYGHLEGELGPRVSVRQGHETEGVDLRVGISFAVCFAEHRGIWRNAGV